MYIFRAIARWSSSTRSEPPKMDLTEKNFKKLDSCDRNVIHYAVSKPESLRKILENPETVKFENVH